MCLHQQHPCPWFCTFTEVGSASNVYGGTPIRYEAQFATLTGQPYALLSPQSMNHHWQPSGILGGEDGSKWDFYWRNLTAGNDDLSFLDSVLDYVINTQAQGKIDTNRLYVSGHSNGCEMAALYGGIRGGASNHGGMGQSLGTTPSGYRIAAGMPFSCSGPFTRPAQNPTCHVSPRPSLVVPMIMVVRQCDLVPCASTNAFVAMLQAQGSPQSELLLLDADQGVLNGETECYVPSDCTYAKQVEGHMNYPSGSVMQRMLYYLWNHTLTSTWTPATSASPSSTTSLPTTTRTPSVRTGSTREAFCIAVFLAFVIWAL